MQFREKKEILEMVEKEEDSVSSSQAESKVISKECCAS